MHRTRPTTDRILLRPVEAAETLGVSLRSLMSWHAAGEIPGIRLGRRTLRFSVIALQELIAAKANEQRTAATTTATAATRPSESA